MKLHIVENGNSQHAALLKKHLEARIEVEICEDGMQINLTITPDSDKIESYRIDQEKKQYLRTLRRTK